MHVDQNRKTSTDTLKDRYHVASWKVFVEQPGVEGVEIGQFPFARVERARQLAAAAAATLAVPVVDTSKATLATPTEEERLASEFLQCHGVNAPPKGFKVQAIKVVRSFVEALFS